jgi:hypothetical protein
MSASLPPLSPKSKTPQAKPHKTVSTNRNKSQITEMKSNSPTPQSTGGLMSFYGWLASLDKTRSTGWRWRKDGLVKTVNVFGKLYVTREEVARFETRALAGEFYREAKTPTPRARAAA